MAITTNTGAKKIEGNENWRNIFDIHNDTVEAYDARIAELQEGLAIIVDGDTAAVAVPAGSYAFLKNNTHGLANGLYKNTSGSAFPVTGGTADSSVFTAEPDGGLNALNSNIANKAKFFDVKKDRVLILDTSTQITLQSDKNIIVDLNAGNNGSAIFKINGYTVASAFTGFRFEMPFTLKAGTTIKFEFSGTGSGVVFELD